MSLSLFNTENSEEVIDLFINVFTTSENEVEGRLVGNLVSDLIATTEQQDLFGFVAISEEKIVAKCLF